MANIREYNMNGTLILGIDHGYGISKQHTGYFQQR